MYRFVVLGALLAAATTATAAAIADVVGSQCIANAGQLPLSFQIEGCSSTPCALPQLEDAVINVKFNAPNNSESLRAQLVFYILNIGIPYDLQADNDACRGLGDSSCPVKEGQELEYTLKLPVEPFFPIGTSVVFELIVLDDAASSAFCARVPVRVVAPTTYPGRGTDNLSGSWHRQPIRVVAPTTNADAVKVN